MTAIAREHQPHLFEEIRGVARAVGQAEPAEVYLVPDVNAFVGQRGGFMGLGSRPVMGLGLPLMQILTVAELRAVLAHEFGHFHGGDVAIGPWICQTRSALLRTLAELQHHSEALMTPFVWYGKLFFRLTHAVSRHQEALADRVATGVAGAQALASGLRLIHGGALAFVPYWKATVEPVLTAGFLPPLAAGFDAFLQSPWVAGKVAESLKEAERSENQSPYDTHPPLPERLSALGVDPASTDRDPGPPALSLLDDLSALETRLVETSVRRAPATPSGTTLGLNPAPEPRALTPVVWDEVGNKVWVPRWQQIARDFGHVLAGVKPASLPELDWKQPGRKLIGRSNADPVDASDSIVGITLAVALSQAGFTVESRPGLEHVLVGRGERVFVFSLRERLAKGSDTPETWRAFCARTGIENVDLGATGGLEPASPAP